MSVVDADAVDRLARGAEQANIPTLLPVLAQLTGDLRWVRDERYRPTAARGFDDNDTGGLAPAIGAEVRDAARVAIAAWLHGAPVALEHPSPEQLVEMLSVAVGEPVPPDYGPMIAATLAEIAGPPAPNRADHSLPGLRVVVIGAGVSGLCAAVALRRAGIDVVILERNSSVGGTWFENRYPGAGVDTPSHLYEFSFAPFDWPDHFALRDDVHAYLERVADEFGLRDHIYCDTAVRRATFVAGGWTVDAIGRDGAPCSFRADAVVSAVGAFNQPKFPAIPGLERFGAEVVHTARWRDLDLHGRRAVVIGNGASAMQLVPAIVDQVAQLTVIQRSPHWIAPFAKFHEAVPDGVRELLRVVPLFRAWTRIRLGWTFNDKLHPTLQRDPTWPHPERSLNAVNDRHRQIFTAYLQRELGDRSDLIAALTPTYPPYGKRILLDNGWFRALCRPNVRLVTDPVTEIVAEGVRTADGELHECDVLVLATGFDVVRFLSTYHVVGVDGQVLRDVWSDDDARAYAGMAVPGFPNFFILYGPNTQPGHGGSLIAAVEAQMALVMALLERLRRGGGVIEVDPVAFDHYNERVDAAHAQMVWTHPGMSTYYRNARGRVVVNNPFRVVDFWNMTHGAAIEDFTTTSLGEAHVG